MTLVATIDFNGAPVLFGDIVLSRPRGGDAITPYDIPTFRNVNQTETAYLIRGLTRKIVNINDRFALGWAGHQIAAMHFVDALMTDSKDKYYTFDEVKDFFNNIKYPDSSDLYRDLYLTGIFIEPISEEKVKIATFGWDAKKGFGGGLIGPKLLGAIYAGGSGSDDLFNSIESMRDFQLGGHTKSEHQVSSLMTLNLLGNMIGDQIRYGRGLELLYGGGFELASYQDDKVTNLDNVTYVNLTVTRGANSNYTITFNPVLKFCYQGDVLLIRRTDCSKERAQGHIISRIKNELFAISPIYRGLTEHEKSQLIIPELASSLTVYYIYCPQAPDNRPKVCVRSSFVKEEFAALKFIQQGDDLTIGISEEFRRAIFEDCDRLLA